MPLNRKQITTAVFSDSYKIKTVADLYPMFKHANTPMPLDPSQRSGNEWMRHHYGLAEGMEFFIYCLFMFRSEMYVSTVNRDTYYKKIPTIKEDDPTATYPNMFSWLLDTVDITKTYVAEQIVEAQKDCIAYIALTKKQFSETEMSEATGWSSWVSTGQPKNYSGQNFVQGKRPNNLIYGLGSGQSDTAYAWLFYGSDSLDNLKMVFDPPLANDWGLKTPTSTRVRKQMDEYFAGDGGPNMTKLLSGGISNLSNLDPKKNKAAYDKAEKDNLDSIKRAGMGYAGAGTVTGSESLDTMFEIDVIINFAVMWMLIGISGCENLGTGSGPFTKAGTPGEIADILNSAHRASKDTWAFGHYNAKTPSELKSQITQFIKTSFIVGGVMGAYRHMVASSPRYSIQLRSYYFKKMEEIRLKPTRYRVPGPAGTIMANSALGHPSQKLYGLQKDQGILKESNNILSGCFEARYWEHLLYLLNDIVVFSQKIFDEAKSGGKAEQDMVDALSNINKDRIQAYKDLAERFVPYAGSNRRAMKKKKEELNKSIMQCVLLAGMSHLEKISIGMRTNSNGNGRLINKKVGGYQLNKTKPYPWGGRIIPIGVKPYQNTMNALTIPLLDNVYGVGLNDYLKSPEALASGYRSTVRLSKVVKNYKDLDGKLINNGDVVKLPIVFGMAETTKSPEGKEDFLLTNFYSPVDRKIIKSGGGKSDGIIVDNSVLIKSIDVAFKGGNMATAKSDVEVKMSFVLPDIKTIKQYFKGTVKIGKKRHQYKYSFLDLITYTNQSSPTGFASVFRNQYHPDYNRLLLESHIYYESALKTASEPANAATMEAALMQVPLVLDIAVVDHEIKKDDKTLQAEVTVTYRGYIHSALSDPTYDALAGPDLLDRRVNKEIQMQRKLEEGCDVDKLRALIRDFNEDTRGDSVFVIPRIIEQLQSSQRLFKVSVSKQAIRTSLNAYADGIKYPKRILDAVKKEINLTTSMQAWHFYKEMDSNSVPEKKRKSLINSNFGKASSNFFTDGLDFSNKYKDWYTMSGKSKGSATKKYKDLKKAIARKTLLDKDYEGIEFFFFGDLIDVLLDSVHLAPVHIGKSGKAIAANRNIRTVVDLPFHIHKSQVKKLDKGYYFKPDPIKVILSSFEWFEWNHENGGKFEAKYSNLADIPISLSWFADWFGEEIIKKKLSYYPIANFIRKLAQTVVTRLLGEICFEVGSDKKVLFRAISNFGLIADDAATIKRYKDKNTTKLVEDYKNFVYTRKSYQEDKGVYMIDYTNNVRMKELPLIQKNTKKIDFNTSQKDYFTNYLIFYPANASSFEYMTTEGSNQWLRAGIPEFKQLTKVTQFYKDKTYATKPEAMIESMSFTKKDAPYRREVKFFASNQGNIAQISGVYNVKIKLTAAAYFLYPGQVCWVDGGLGQNPSSPKTLAFQLGIGGYYQIITVNHKMAYYGGQSPIAKTEIEASWIGYGVKKSEQKAAFFRAGIESTPKSAACNSSLPTRKMRLATNYSSDQYRKAAALAGGKPPPGAGGAVPGTSPGKNSPVRPNVMVGADAEFTGLGQVQYYNNVTFKVEARSQMKFKVTQVEIVNKTMNIPPARVNTSEAERKAAMQEDYVNVRKAWTSSLIAKDNYDEIVKDMTKPDGKYKMMKKDNVHVGYIVRAERQERGTLGRGKEFTMKTTVYYDKDNKMIAQIIHKDTMPMWHADFMVFCDGGEIIYQHTGGVSDINTRF